MAHEKATLRPDNSQRIEQAKKEIASYQAEKQRCYTLFKKGLIGESELDRDYERLNEAIKAAKRYQASLLPVSSVISPRALAYADAPFERWGVVRMTTEEKRALLTAVCPDFNILAKGNGGRGAGARTTFRVAGFWLRIDAGKEPDCSKKPVTSEGYELASNLSHCRTIATSARRATVQQPPRIWAMMRS